MVDFKHGLTRPVYYSIQRNLGLYSNYRVKSIGWHATTTTIGSPTEIIVDTSKWHTSLCPRGYRGERLTTSPSSGIEDNGRCSASPAYRSNLRSKFKNERLLAQSARNMATTVRSHRIGVGIPHGH